MITALNQLDLNARYTYSDYLKWQFEDRVELIRGKVFHLFTPDTYHQTISMNLSMKIYGNSHQSKYKVFYAPFDVRLPRFYGTENKEIITVVQPDICVICDKNKIDEKGCIGAPDIIIEILSPGNSKKEMKDKFSVYEESGVKEYWIIYPDDKSISRFILNDQGKYIGLQPLTEDDVLTTPILQGLEINLADIFEK